MKRSDKPKTDRWSLDPKLIVTLVLLCAFSVVMNTYGINWGLPDGTHFHPSFHPDETASLESSVMILSPQNPLFPSPTGLGNGPMQFYVTALAYLIGYGGRLDSILSQLTGPRFAQLYLVGRYLTVLMSAACAVALFFIGLRLFSYATGLISGLFFIVLPATVTNSHYFRPDIPATLWVLLAFLAGIALMRSGKVGAYAAAGIFVGFATATKYNCMIIFMALVYAHIGAASRGSKKMNLRAILNRKLLIAVLVFLVAFAVAAPGTFLYWNTFIERVAKQFQYQTSHTFMDTMDLGSGWIGYLTRILPYSLGLPMLLLAIAGMIYAFVRRNKADIMLLLWVVPYYFLIGRSDWWVVRYTVPLMPFFALITGRLCVEVFKRLKASYLRYLPVVVGAGVFAFTLAYSLELDRVLASPEPRHQAYDWVDQHVMPDKVIGFDFLPQAFFSCVNEQRHAAQYMQMNPQHLDKIDYYVANDQVYLQFVRLSQRYPVQARYFQTILASQRFVPLVRFENVFNLLGMKMRKVDIPHDYLYFMPRIEVFKNQSRSSANE